jgi:hypothetical protein
MRSVVVVGPDGEEKSGALKVLEWSADQRASRAIKRLGMWWGAGIVGIVMPPHLLWFTLGMVGGPVAAWLAAHEGALVHAQDVACPKCGAPVALEEQAERWPMGARCRPCRMVFWISPATAQAAPIDTPSARE